MGKFEEIKKLFNITESNGFSEQEILVFKDISASIPQVLYDYYAKLGKVDKLNHSQDNLLIPNKLKWSKNQDYLLFYVENQYACVWGIYKNDLEKDNPPVYMSTNQEKWEKETDDLISFLNAMANLQAAMSLDFCLEEFYFIAEKDLEIIKKNYQKRNYSFSKWISIEFYGNEPNDVIAIFKNDGYYDLVYASGNAEQFEKLNDILGDLGE